MPNLPVTLQASTVATCLPLIRGVGGSCPKQAREVAQRFLLWLGTTVGKDQALWRQHQLIHFDRVDISWHRQGSPHTLVEARLQYRTYPYPYFPVLNNPFLFTQHPTEVLQEQEYASLEVGKVGNLNITAGLLKKRINKNVCDCSFRYPEKCLVKFPVYLLICLQNQNSWELIRCKACSC